MMMVVMVVILMILVMVVMVILVMINFAQVRPREADHVQGHELSHNGQFRQFTALLLSDPCAHEVQSLGRDVCV